MRALLIAAAALAAPAAAQTLQPGQWEITSRTLSMSMPNMPPEALKAMTGRTTTIRHCVTPADVAAGPAKLFGASDGKCRFTSYSMKAGRMSSVMQCAGGPGGPMTVKSSGTFTATSYTATSEMSGGMTIKSEVSGRRVGACPK